MFSVTISVLTILVAFQVTGSVAQQTTPELIKINGNSYYFSTQKRDWIEGVIDCRRLNLHAVSFDTLDDYHAVANYLTSQKRTDWFWTAGHDLVTPNKFEWISSRKPMNVAPWSPGNPSPDLNNGNEACVHMMLVNGEWMLNDHVCDISLYYICKADPGTTTSTPTTNGKIDWCDPALCPGSSGRTAACLNPTEKWGPDCSPDAMIYEVNSTLREALLHKHNSYRNDVVGGVKYPQFKPAARMPPFIWDNELAFLAKINLKKCYLGADQCVGTPKYKNAGQSLSGIGFYGTDPNVTDIAERCIEAYFNGYKNATMNEINSFTPFAKDGSYIGYFTQILQDKAVAVGCAIFRQEKDGITWQYLTCNYSFSNKQGERVYVTDVKPGTKCTTGMNPKYPNLCSGNEVVTN